METHVDEKLIRQLAKSNSMDVNTETNPDDFSRLLKIIEV
jgi:hypothetical protein